MNTSTDLDHMAEMNELDDLGNLFEFGEIDLNTIPDPTQYADHLSQSHGTHPNTPFQDMSEPPPMSGTTAQDFGGQEPFRLPQSLDQHPYARQHDARAPTSNPYTSESMYQPSIQPPYNPYPQTFNFQPQSGFPPNHHVPPTPNSYEMHGETGRFMQQHMQMDAQQRAILEQRYQVRKDDAIAFTPMVSPAGTPQYNMLPEYTTPGAYFSPLTSPMLHAQNQHQAQLQQRHQQQGYLTNPSTATSSNTNSPVDPQLDVEMMEGIAIPDPAAPKTRKSRRNIAPPRSATGPVKGKQTPAQSTQKRKSVPLSNSLPTSTPEHYALRSVATQPASAGLQMPPQFDSSEAESISPEPLSESIMGPPPRPGSSLTQSPALAGQQQQNASVAAVGAAATPKSLLTMRGAQQPVNGQQHPAHASQHAANDSVGLDDLALPEAASSHGRRKPSLTQINTQLVPSATEDNAPRLSARKTPKLGPLSTPASARPGSVLESPTLVGSPMAASTPSAILKDKKDARGQRANKKRGSMSANGSRIVSPALVPKISPSIKPLLPEGTPLNTATQAMLLASKSNYQNLLEGNHLPGVTYPDSLSTGLTSKRTSHKVAEQGRRNRINEALKEMQSLIPKSSSSSKSPVKDSDGDGEGSVEGGECVVVDRVPDANGKEDAGGKSNSSKAATVELANEYIKRMQKDSAMQNAEVLQLKRENEELKKRLGEQANGGSPIDSPASTSFASTKVT